MNTCRARRSGQVQSEFAGTCAFIYKIPTTKLLPDGWYNLLCSCTCTDVRINNTSFAHRHRSLYVLCDGYRRFAQSSALLQTLNQGLSVSLGRWQSSQENCKICLKSAGLNAFFGWICVVLFCLKASHH